MAAGGGTEAEAEAEATAGATAALLNLPQQVPVQYDRLGRELQKWIQCSRCEKWRRVPYGLDDNAIPDEWQCKDNVWDPPHNSCDVQQQVGRADGLAGGLATWAVGCPACWQASTFAGRLVVRACCRPLLPVSFLPAQSTSPCPLSGCAAVKRGH